jgi:hypothetical protein
VVPATPEPTLSDVLSTAKRKGDQLDFDLDVPSRFTGEPAVIEAILAHVSLSLENLPEEALADRAILLTIARGGVAFSEFPEWARDDDEIARVAVTQGRSSFARDAAFEAAAARLRGDRAFVLLAFCHGARYDAVKHIADDRLQEDLEILKRPSKAHGQSFGCIPEKLRSHPDLIEILLAGKLYCVSCFDGLPASYRDDVEIAVKAIDSDASCFLYLSERLRDDDELAMRAPRVGAAAGVRLPAHPRWQTVRVDRA